MTNIDRMNRNWPDALQELTTKFVAKEPITLWIRDMQLEFTIGLMKRKTNGYQFTLTSRRGADLYIETNDDSDTVELSFYSKGQP